MQLTTKEDKWHVSAKGFFYFYMDYIPYSVLLIRPHCNVTKRSAHDLSRGQASCSHVKHKYNLNTISLHGIYSQGSRVTDLLKVVENLAHPSTAVDYSIYPIFTDIYPILTDIHPIFNENSCKSGWWWCGRKSWTAGSEQQKRGWEGNGLNTGLIVCRDGKSQSEKGLQLLQREYSWICV